jgi:hypothetical protein
VGVASCHITIYLMKLRRHFRLCEWTYCVLEEMLVDKSCRHTCNVVVFDSVVGPLEQWVLVEFDRKIYLPHVIGIGPT